MRRTWRMFAVAAAFVAVATIVILLIEPNVFVRGLLVGALWAATVMALVMLVSQATGSASTNMGALAEQWTASELRALRSAGWMVINHFLLSQSDIDHLVFRGRRVFAIETKWSGTGWKLDHRDRYLSSAIAQVKRSARSMALWQDVKAAGVGQVQAVLFLWGGLSEAKPLEPQIVDGVLVIYGKKASEAWRERLLASEPSLDPTATERLWAAFDAQIVTRDGRELEENPPLPGLERIWWTGFGAFIVGSISLFASLWVLRLGNSFWKWGVAAGLAACVVWPLGRKFSRLRPLVAGWLFGLAASAILVIVWLVGFISTR